MQAAWTTVVAENALLRTRWIEQDGHVVGVVDSIPSLSPLATSSPERLDPETGPSALLAVTSTPQGTPLLHLATHHVITDSHTHTTTMKALLTRYAADSTASLDTADDGTHLRSQALSTVDAVATRGAVLREFWRRAGWALSERSATDKHKSSGAVSSLPIPKGVLERLRQVSDRLAVPPAIACIALYAHAIARCDGLTDAAVAFVHQGASADASRLQLPEQHTCWAVAERIGPQTNLDAIRHTAHGVLDAIDHAELALGEKLNAGRSVRSLPPDVVTFHTEPLPISVDDITLTPLFSEANLGTFTHALRILVAQDGTQRGEIAFRPGEGADRASHLLLELKNLADSLSNEPDCEAKLPVRQPARPPDQRVARVEDLFDRHSASTRQAVVSDGTSRDYRTLHAESIGIAGALIQQGVARGDRVGLLLADPSLIAGAVLGVFRAGAMYVPLDPAQPAARLNLIRADADIDVVLTTADLRSRARDFCPRIVTLDDAARLAGDEPLPSVGTVDDPAYLLYTSGSTGEPKGVVVTHRNISAMLEGADKAIPFNETDTWLVFHSYAFDFSVWELWGALTRGGTAVVLQRKNTRNPAAVLEAVAGHGVSMLSLTPSAWRMLRPFLMDAMAAGHLPALRTVVFGGERLAVEDVNEWLRRFGDTRPLLVNMYGITEITVHATAHRLTVADLDRPDSSPIGHALPHLRIRLVNDVLEDVPHGQVGEILVGGDGVAQGYWRDPERTAQRFHLDSDGTRWYQSGDFGQFTVAGLDYRGRSDDQVQVRGHRVELGEVQASLLRVTEVSEAVVVAHEEAAGTIVEAFYVGHSEPDGVLSTLANLVPTYMRPHFLHRVPTIPLTNNGKPDMEELRSMAPRGRARRAPDVPASTDRGDLIGLAVWKEILPVPPTSLDDTFFDLGGDSLRAIELVAAYRREGISITVEEILEHQTIAAINAAGREREPLGSEAPAPVARFALVSDEDRARLPSTAVDAYPLSHAQRGMMIELLRESGQDEVAYHNVTAFRVRGRGALNEELLRRAYQRAVNRHECLRTTIALYGFTEILQIVHVGATADVVAIDLPAAAEPEQQIEEVITRELATPFEITSAPLVRLRAVPVGPEEWVLVITEFHPMIEGWSYHTLLMEILDGYSSELQGRATDTAPLPAHRFADHIAAELEAADARESRVFWQRRLAQAVPVVVGTPQGVVGERVRITVPYRDLADGLNRLARRAGGSLKHIIIAAHLLAIADHTGSRQFYSGLIVDTRPELPGMTQVLGMYLNTIPFTFTHDSRRDLAWHVRQVVTEERAVWPHRRVPLIEHKRMGARFDTIVNFQQFRQVDTESVHPQEVIDRGHTEFGLSVNTAADELSYNTSTGFMPIKDVERLAGRARGILAAMAMAGYSGEDQPPAGEATGECHEDAGRATVLPGLPDEEATSYPHTMLQIGDRLGSVELAELVAAAYPGEPDTVRESIVVLADVWQENVASLVGHQITSTFTQMGADSLALLTFFGALHKRGTNLLAEDVFQHDSFHALARELHTRARQEPDRSTYG